MKINHTDTSACSNLMYVLLHSLHRVVTQCTTDTVWNGPLSTVCSLYWIYKPSGSAGQPDHNNKQSVSRSAII